MSGSIERTQKRLSAVLIADIVGYTKLVEKDTSHTVAAWKEARRNVIDPAVNKLQGRIVKFTGDGFLAEFPTVEDAVSCAIQMQRQLVDSVLNFRMAVNLGDVIDDGDDIHGEGVNIAARIEAIADPGSITISGSVFEQVRNRITANYQDLGERELKHVSAPVHIYQISNLTLAVAESEYRPPAHVPSAEISSPSPVEKSMAQSPIATDAKPRLIVLPFRNVNNVEDNDFLVDGIVEDLITEFSRLNSIEVISRNTAFAFKGKDVNNANIAAEYGIHFIATGSIRSSGNRIRISVDLTDPILGSALWSERYDRLMDDVFEVQDEIVRKVMVALVGKLETESLERAKRKPTDSLSSYEYLLRGRDFHHKFSKDGVLSAIEMLDKSIQADPGNAQAYAWKACAIGQGLINGYIDGSTEEGFAEAKSMIQTALEIDHNDFECNRIMCEINKSFEDFDQSEFYGRKAYQMNPNDPRIVSAYGELLVLTGRADEGTDLLIKAHDLDPVGMGASNADKRLGDIMFGAYVKRDFQQCLYYDNKVGKKSPIAWAAKIASLASMNENQKKDAELTQFKATYPDLVLENEIEKLHFQDTDEKQAFKDLVM
jgi:adenylate cyclase